MPLSKIINKLDKNKLKENFLKLPITAKKEGWVTSYDKLADALYVTPKSMPNGTSLYNITNEYAIFVTPSANVKGIFIENYSSNFVKHHTNFEGFLDVLKPEDHDEIYIVKDEEKAKLFQSALQDNLIESLADKNQLLAGAKFFAT